MKKLSYLLMLFGAFAFASCENGSEAVNYDVDEETALEESRGGDYSYDGEVAEDAQEGTEESVIEEPAVEEPVVDEETTGSSYTENANGLDIKMVYVEGGRFTMGASDESLKGRALPDEFPVHNVTLSSFYIGECEVTQEQWYKVMGTTLAQQGEGSEDYDDYGVGNNRPMYYVSWDEANRFCERLSELTGKHYTLPTEAQWEYAARGGKHSNGYTYSGSNNLRDVAWYSVNTLGQEYYAHDVKTKAANELGLYDMSGNVFEWCLDWYGKYSANDSETVNPTGALTGTHRVLRGGSWNYVDRDCRVSYRSYQKPDGRYNIVGFRVVCTDVE